MNAAADAPFVGPRPFAASERDVFFGRDREIAQLTSLVVAHQTVLLYAVSGAGKSSLLSAGVEPALASEGFEVLTRMRLRGPVLPPTEAANAYVFAAIASVAQPVAPDLTLAAYLAERPRGTDAYGFPSPRLLVFDQFEELFALHQSRWPDREGFFEQIAAALAADPSLRVLFAMREEYLAQLDRFAPLLADHLRTRFHLERLRRDAANLAVEGPLEASGVAIEAGVADTLVTDLQQTRIDLGDGRTATVAGEYVEPVHLQVVCRTLWNRLEPGVTEVTAEHVAALGSVDESLRDYYDEAVAAAAGRARMRERRLRDRIERSFVTPAGTRASVFAGAGKPADIPAAALEELGARHLLRAEWRAGARWLELAHDRLIEPLRRSNAALREHRRRRLTVVLGAAASLALLAGGGLLMAALLDRSEPATATPYDFTGDGRQNLVVGLPLQDEAGVVVIVSGQELDDANVIRPQDAVAGLLTPRAGFGAALASADFDGDGWADLAVGAPGDGLVAVAYGSSDSVLRGRRQTIQAPPGPGDTRGFGSALVASDLDGDGHGDLVVGAGGIHIFRGETDGGLVTGDRVLEPPVGVDLTSFGARLRVGDVDADGHPDLVEGAPGPDGHLSLCPGSQEGPTRCVELGASLPTASLAVGDIDGDGYDDIVQGDPTAGGGSTGEVRLWRGSPDRVGETPLVITQDSPGIRGNPQEGDGFGRAVEAGDVDGDGFADIIVGAPGEDADAGRITLILGTPEGPGGAGSTAVQLRSKTPGSEFGTLLSLIQLTAGDRPDLVATQTADSLELSIQLIPQGIATLTPRPITGLEGLGLAYEPGSPIRLGRNAGG